MKRVQLILGMILISLISCVSTTKMIEKGNYDQAIEKLVHKLAGNKNKKRDDVINLEYAFKKAQSADLALESAYLEDKEESKWLNIYNIHTRIENRQAKIEPLLPIISKDGYQAAFNFINTKERKRESKNNSIEFLYMSAKDLIENSKRTKNKESAREAYNKLLQIDGFTKNYKDIEQLKKETKYYGTSHYLVKIVNNTQTIIPVQLESDLLSISVKELDKNWKAFDMRLDPSVTYDYNIIMNLTSIEFSPEREKTRIIDDVMEEETEEILKDRFGKPILDSLGKEQKRKYTETHTSTLEEVTQVKSAIIGGRLDWINLINNNIEYTKPIQVENLFENKFARLIRGDASKVSKLNQKLLKNRAVGFPSNQNMLLDTGEKLKNIIKDMIFEHER
ncbi:MAG: hypothetical protein IT265_07675 [Saprospiraceae bacterium]|nr:hypothetical protein [Saprospiraceae bacterium]